MIGDKCMLMNGKTLLALEALDRTLQDIRGSSRLMGGVIVVLAGDFRKTLKATPRFTPADELSACLKAYYLWRHVHKMTLITNMRVHLLGDESVGVLRSSCCALVMASSPSTLKLI
ncbi:hypothetical protein ANCCEY_05790 [Ancylostoma ceylanicum]|uniref:ATP-dependent DNA helicase n=2 Tax=Ancylostoma ceylanicum TaxID=53326 RepID=A0A0D6LYD4_9BILA|nr:hypothetical protein ANCCEY_05790 [Ancylostoma ceylanicum]EYB94511.1 hypothetical protein Y032_0170g238 [Ancylostoma ceylanicum]